MDEQSTKFENTRREIFGVAEIIGALELKFNPYKLPGQPAPAKHTPLMSLEDDSEGSSP